MVGADGGGPDEAHARGAEQLPVAAAAGAHEQRIGVEHMLLPDGAARQTADLRICLLYTSRQGRNIYFKEILDCEACLLDLLQKGFGIHASPQYLSLIHI